jgi:hypothetical protein
MTRPLRPTKALIHVWGRPVGSGGVDCLKKQIPSPDEVLKALKRYLADFNAAEEVVASQIGVNHHTLRRWLSDKESPKKQKLALAAVFLRRAGYL